MKYVRLYGFDHRRTQTQFQVAWNELRQGVPKKGSIVLGVSEDKLLLDGVPVESGQAERGFAQLLTAAGVSSIQFFSELTIDEFEDLVRAFALGGSRAEDFAAHIRMAIPQETGHIRINEVKFIAADPATANVTAAAQIAAQSLSPEFKEWLSDPTKLVQLIAAAEGAMDPAAHARNDAQLTLEIPVTETTADGIFALNEQDTIEALRLLTRFGELGTLRTPKPELIGVELHRSPENIRKTVLAVLEELAAYQDSKADKPLLMRAAEQMAIHYALERFQSGDLKVNAVHELLEEMSRQMGNLRKILSYHEEKMSKAGLLVESHADLLDRKFWAELPEHSKDRKSVV